jgi:hypothetical protein
VLIIGITTFVTNVITQGVRVKDEPCGFFLDHDIVVIDLCDSSNEDASLPIFVFPSSFSIFNSIAFGVTFQSNQKVVYVFIPLFLVGKENYTKKKKGSFRSVVVSSLKSMSFAPCATSELKKLNYHTLCIENVPYIPSTFNGDVLFELPLINNIGDHFDHM